MEIARYAIDVATTHRVALLTCGTSLACLFSVLSVTQCRFMTNDEVDYGLFMHPYIDDDGKSLGCIRYSHETVIDSGLKTGRGFGTITLLCAMTAWSVMVYATLWSDKRPILWKIAHGGLALAALSQMLVFAALSSDLCSEGGCALARGGVLSVLNTILLDVLCLAWFFVPVPAKTSISWREGENTGDGDGSTEKRATVRRPLETRKAESVASGETQDSPDSPEVTSNVQDLLYFRLTTVGLLGIVWVVSLLGIKRCSFLAMAFDEYGVASIAGLGLFSQALYSEGTFLGCIDFPSSTKDEFDGSFRTARAFGVITTFLTTTIFMLSVLLLVYKKLIQKFWFALRIMLPAVTCTQLVTLAALDSSVCEVAGESECSIGGTGVIVLLNIFLTATLSALILIQPAPQHMAFKVHLTGYKANDNESQSTVVLGQQTEAQAVLDDQANRTDRTAEALSEITRQERVESLVHAVRPSHTGSGEQTLRKDRTATNQQRNHAKQLGRVIPPKHTHPTVKAVRNDAAGRTSQTGHTSHSPRQSENLGRVVPPAHPTPAVRSNPNPPMTTLQQRRSDDSRRMVPSMLKTPVHSDCAHAIIGAQGTAPRVLRSPTRTPEQRLLETSPEVSSIVVTVDYTETEKRTVKEVIYMDGSKTVTTTIEEISSGDDSYLPDDTSQLDFRP